MPVVFIEKFHKLDISSPAQLDCLLEQRPTEVAGDHGVAVGVNHDDGDRHQRQLLVRDKVHLGPGSEQPGEDRAGQDGGPGFGPGVTVELVRQVVEGRLQDEGTESAWERETTCEATAEPRLWPHTRIGLDTCLFSLSQARTVSTSVTTVSTVIRPDHTESPKPL